VRLASRKNQRLGLKTPPARPYCALPDEADCRADELERLGSRGREERVVQNIDAVRERRGT
jgi:hypothetical protein